MSNARQQVLLQATTAAHNSYSCQLKLLVNSKRLSSDIKEKIVSLFLEISRLDRLSPFPDVPDDVVANITSKSVVNCDDCTQDDLNAVILALQNSLNSIGANDTFIDPLMTDDLLNKRMIDLMGDVKRNIRQTARQHNDNGGHYDKDAFVSVRNQVYLSRRVYLEQLDHDLVQATNEDCATIEQIIFPNILNSTADQFVATVEALSEFLKDRVLSTLV